MTYRTGRLIEKQQEQYLRDLASLEHEVDIASQRTKLEMLKKKLDYLEKDTDAATLLVRLVARSFAAASRHKWSK